eukprot:CAMPEP_0205803082 /NCGR_PEP_ID=MMETSP0205-20121125/5629_1 /ASSEMBLY_ACC=CAM_ASM_000278 /TAXON_ID=36767 /ORGANISM="Euplotes focardii, Strain TN1" /LENGTH=45 /DNA_ID= /DNA_START= /DNA_END= /DNA_ORIENTATION=
MTANSSKKDNRFILDNVSNSNLSNRKGESQYEFYPNIKLDIVFLY